MKLRLNFLTCLLSIFIPVSMIYIVECFAQAGTSQTVEIASYYETIANATDRNTAYDVVTSSDINTGGIDPDGLTTLTNVYLEDYNTNNAVAWSGQGDLGLTGVLKGSAPGSTYFIDLGAQPTEPGAHFGSLVTCNGGKITMRSGMADILDAPTDMTPLEGKHVYDIAEGIRTQDAEAGDVVIISPKEDMLLVKSRKKFDTRVAGVISKNPKLYMGPGQERMPLALAGIVECKVTSENGPIKKGDVLVSSSTPGHAMRAQTQDVFPGMVIGSALENFSQNSGEILILVNQ